MMSAPCESVPPPPHTHTYTHTGIRPIFLLLIRVPWRQRYSSVPWSRSESLCDHSTSQGGRRRGVKPPLVMQAQVWVDPSPCDPFRPLSHLNVFSQTDLTEASSGQDALIQTMIHFSNS